MKRFVRLYCLALRLVPARFHDRAHYFIWNWIDNGFHPWLRCIGEPEPAWDELKRRFPITLANRPSTCTRSRMKPYMDDCGCWWCGVLDEKTTVMLNEPATE